MSTNQFPLNLNVKLREYHLLSLKLPYYIAYFSYFANIPLFLEPSFKYRATPTHEPAINSYIPAAIKITLIAVI